MVAKAPPDTPTLFDTWDMFVNYFPERVPEEYRNSTLGSYISCGVTHMSGLSGVTPKQIVDKVLVQRHFSDKKTTREAFVLFSDIAGSGGYGPSPGERLCQYIRDNNLGDIGEFGPRKNPNTDNMIKLWVWMPPHESLEPKDKNMPVYGKVREYGPSGHFARYVNGIEVFKKPADLVDKRFEENLNGASPAREA